MVVAMGHFGNEGRFTLLVSASILVQLVSSRRLFGMTLPESGATSTRGGDVSEPSLAEFGAALPDGSDVSGEVVSVIVKKLVEVRKDEDANRCPITLEPLLVDDKVGPDGLVAVVAPPGPADPPSTSTRVDFYTVHAARRWICKPNPVDPIINVPLARTPQTRFFALSPLQGPLCPPYSHVVEPVDPEEREARLWNVPEPERLRVMAHHCDADGISQLLEHMTDTDVSRVDAEGRTALHEVAVAARQRVAQCLPGARLLLARMDNASVGLQDRAGHTALHLAALWGMKALVHLLLAHMNDSAVRAETHSQRRTALAMAAQRGCVGTVRELLARSSDQDVRHQDSRGHMPLHGATTNMPYPRRDRAGQDLVDFRSVIAVLMSRMDEDALLMENSEGQNPLQQAASVGHVLTVEALLRGMSSRAVCAPEAQGWTALHRAAQSGHANIVKALLNAIPDDVCIAVQDSAGRTALHLAMTRQSGEYCDDLCVQQQDTVRMLLERMSQNPVLAQDIVTKDYLGKTALHAACSESYHAEYASSTANIANVQQLLRYMGDADVSAPDQWGRTALQWAAHFGRDGLVEALLGRMNDLAVRARDDTGKTALHHAVVSGSFQVVGRLLRRMDREAIHQRDDEGMTALKIARQRWHFAAAARIAVHI